MGRPRRLQLFATDIDALQITWGELPPGPVEFRAGGQRVTVQSDGGPGATEIGDLDPGSSHPVEVSGPEGPIATLSARTLDPLAGPERFRFATISDLHLGEDNFGLLSRMVESPQPDQAHPWRCSQAAIAEAVAWGAQLLVVKGDVTKRGRIDEWRQFGDLIDGLDIPVEVIPGNHDVEARREISFNEAVIGLGLKPIDGARFVDLPGLRLVLVDTTWDDHKAGQVTHAADIATDAVRDASGPAMVALHHYPQRTPLPYFWPPGIRPDQARSLCADLAAANPATILTSGHTHRNRRYHRSGLVVTEVGSTKDYPGGWAGYAVHDDGIRQVTRRVSRPDCIGWTDYTRRAVNGAWGVWSPGQLDDRCFVHRWAG